MRRVATDTKGNCCELTGVDQFESFPRGFWVTVKLQPKVIGSGDESQAQHGRAGEGPQDMGHVVFAVVNLI